MKDRSRLRTYPVLFLLGGLFLTCSQKKSPVIPATCADQVDFIQCIQPIFNARCVGCHGPYGGLSLEEGQAEANLINVPATCDPAFMRVLPGFPQQSMLYLKITDDPAKCGSRMPASGDPLPQDEIDLIRRWIEGLPP